MKNPIIKIMMMFAVILIISSCSQQETEYKVHFQTTFGTPVSSMVLSSMDDFIMPEPPVKTGHTFGGWYLDNESFQIPFDDTYRSTHELSGNMILYARWIKNQYAIEFEVNGGDPLPIMYVGYQDEIDAPVVQKEGYVFEGWYIDSDLTLRYTFRTMPDMNLKLYVKWGHYEYIRFEENGGSPITLIYQPVGSIVDAPSRVYKEGYIFEGWYSDPEFNHPYEFSVMPDVSITLYAKWSLKTCTLYLLENEGEPLDDIVQLYGTPLILPTPVREGYIFNGWYNLNSTLFNSTTMPDDTYIYARWDHIYFVIPFMSEGELYTEYHLVYGNDMHFIDGPVREGYLFDGWYLDETYQTPYVFGEPVTSQFTLYAKWIVNP